MEGTQPLKKYFESYQNLPKAVWYLSMVAFISSLGGTIMTFTALYLSTHYSLPVSSIGQVMVIYSVGVILGGYSGGKICDRLDARLVLIASLVLSSISIFLISFSTSLSITIYVLFFLGLFDGAFRPAYNVLLTRCCPLAECARGYSLYHMLINLALAVGTGIGGFLSQKKFVYLCWMSTAAGFFAVLLLFVYYKRIVTVDQEREDASRLKPASPWRDRRFLILCGLLLIVTSVFFQIKTTYPIYLNAHYHISNTFFGVLMAINGILIVTCEVPLIQFVKRFPPEQVGGIGALFLCLGFGLLPLGSTITHVLLCLALWTLGEILVYPIAIGMVAAMASKENQGSYMAIYQSVFSICLITSSYFGSLLYDYAGANALWGICGAIGLLAFLGFLKMERRSATGENEYEFTQQ